MFVSMFMNVILFLILHVNGTRLYTHWEVVHAFKGVLTLSFKKGTDTVCPVSCLMPGHVELAEPLRDCV